MKTKLELGKSVKRKVKYSLYKLVRKSVRVSVSNSDNDISYPLVLNSINISMLWEIKL